MKLNRRVAATLVLAIGASLAMVGAAMAAVVTNGSFENGAAVPANTFINVPAGNTTTITGWTVVSGNVDYINGYWQAADGTRSLDLNGTTAGSVSQTLATFVGATYTVDFSLAGNPEGGPAVKTGTVSATGATPAPFSFDTTGKTKLAMGWSARSYSFTATVPSTTLTFASTTNVGSFYGPTLDHVAISKPGIRPATVEAVVFPGGNTVVNKTVTTPVIPPNPDIVFLADTTGSMGVALTAIKANIGNLMATVLGSQPSAQFGAAHYNDFGDPTQYALTIAVTSSTAAVVTAVNNCPSTTGFCLDGGGDAPESQLNALNHLATDPIGFRTGSSRIVVWFGDQPGHDPSGGITEAAATFALQTAGIRVIAISVGANNLDGDPDGGGPLLAGQATRITSATGGVLLSGINQADISAAILTGLSNLPALVQMHSNCSAVTAGVITTTFSPASVTVPSGTDASFVETITVAANAPGGTYTCIDWATINGVDFNDAAGNLIVETKTIRVPEGFLTGGGHIDNGNGPKAERISFGGNVGYLADFSIVGNWNVQFHNVKGTVFDKTHFKSDSFSVLQFGNVCGPAANPPPANANSGRFVAAGTLDGVAGYTLEVWFADFGEPGKDSDAIRFRLSGPLGVYDSWIGAVPIGDFADNDDQCTPDEGPLVDVHRHQLDGGNLQIHSGVKN